MRDLQKDLEICNKATPGPWRCLDDTPVDPEWASIFPQDLDFVMESREGWPHAIERAIKAETEVERLQKQLEVVEKHCKETFAEIRIQHHDEIEKYKQALRIFTNVDIPIEDKCWFKGKVVDMPCIKNKKLNLKCKKCVRDEFLKDG